MQTYHRLNDVNMSAIDRERAKEHMRSAELTIDFVAAVLARTCSVGAAIWQRAINLARLILTCHRRAPQ